MIRQVVVILLLGVVGFSCGCAQRVKAAEPLSAADGPKIRILVKPVAGDGTAGQAIIADAPGNVYINPPWNDVILSADAKLNFPEGKYNEPAGGVKQLELRWGTPTLDYVIVNNRDIDSNGTVPDFIAVNSTDAQHNAGPWSIRTRVEKPMDVSAIATDYFGNRTMMTVRLIPSFKP